MKTFTLLATFIFAFNAHAAENNLLGCSYELFNTHNGASASAQDPWFNPIFVSIGHETIVNIDNNVSRLQSFALKVSSHIEYENPDDSSIVYDFSALSLRSSLFQTGREYYNNKNAAYALTFGDAKVLGFLNCDTPFYAPFHFIAANGTVLVSRDLLDKIGVRNSMAEKNVMWGTDSAQLYGKLKQPGACASGNLKLAAQVIDGDEIQNLKINSDSIQWTEVIKTCVKQGKLVSTEQGDFYECAEYKVTSSKDYSLPVCKE
jgi:hypothetical protein